jgi:hypothetical protein
MQQAGGEASKVRGLAVGRSPSKAAAFSIWPSFTVTGCLYSGERAVGSLPSVV